MNRIYALLTGILLTLPFLAQAQGPGLGLKLKAGVKLGVNMAQLDGKSWDNGYKANLLGGLFLGVRGGRAGVQIEALFSQSSYRTGNTFYDLYNGYYNDIKDSVKEGAFRVNYLNIPILFQVKILNNVWLQLGPQYSGVVSVKDVDGLLKDAEGLFKGGELSGVGGLWIDLPFHLNVGGRYVIGLSDLNETTVDEKWKTKTIQFHVGYSF